MLFGCFMAVYYWYILLVVKVPTDILEHVQYLAQQVCTEHQPMRANSGFHYAVWLLAGFSCDYALLVETAILFLGACWGATVYVSARVGLELTSENQEPLLHDTRRIALVLFVAVASCVLFPLPVAKSIYYLGLIPPNVYHNPTWLSGLPLNMAIFGLAVRQLKSERTDLRAEALISLLLVGSTLCKPSFAFIFAPAYVLLRVARHNWRQWPALALALTVALLPATLLILGQAKWIAAYPQTTPGGAAHFVLAFPAGWHRVMPDLSWERVLLRVFSSFALPGLAYYLQPDWLKRIPHQLALLCSGIGFLIFMLVCETGIRATHGNFMWQAIYGNHLLYWVVAASAVDWQPTSATERKRRKIILAAVLLSLASGILYLAIIVVRKSYA